MAHGYGGGRRRRTQISDRKGVFNPEDAAHVKHTQIGVWDLYEEKNGRLEHIPGSSKLEALLEVKKDLSYVWQMLIDIGKLRSCWTLLGWFCAIDVLLALIPALSIWFKSQLLTVVEIAVEERSVDKALLIEMTLGTFACRFAERLLDYGRLLVSHPLEARLDKHYAVRVFEARARLDVPTFDDPAVQRQLDSASAVNGKGVAFGTISMASSLASTLLKISTQFSVLYGVLKDQRDGMLLAFLCLLPSLLDYASMQRRGSFPGRGVWAATTRNEAFVKMVGLAMFVGNPDHRKELVAGNMADYALATFQAAVQEAGDYANDFWETIRDFWHRERQSPARFLHDCLSELPKVVFAMRAVQYPSSIPVSLASLTLITETTGRFSYTLQRLFQQTGSITDQLATVRKLYQVGSIPNQIRDGERPHPENAQQVQMGIMLEFRDVWFCYPGAHDYALKGVSFRVYQGQLCVIVGANGSGKSTILKLACRLYDVSAGQIPIDGQDIRSLKLADLRQAISVLFQDYTHFPLSIKDNTGLGDPAHAEDDSSIHRAAELGGADEFIKKLPEGYDTYLYRPVQDHYSSLPEGTKTLFGRPVDYNSLRAAANMGPTSGSILSGGQMQRLAVSRTFMRSVVSNDCKVGLLLFDEPSASLDPTAEHDLFTRLRRLRGSKTMIFSSHRFGSLTRDADLILFMDKALIVEHGTHDSLMRRKGEYARIWSMQAEAFL